MSNTFLSFSLGKNETIEVSKKIAEAGSLTLYRDGIKKEIAKLSEKKRLLSDNIEKSTNVDSNLKRSIQFNRNEYEKLKNEIDLKYTDIYTLD